MVSLKEWLDSERLRESEYQDDQQRLREAEDSKNMKKAKLKIKLANLKTALKDMSVTPHSQKEADAIDSVRDEIKDVEAELKALSEGAGYDASHAYEGRTAEVKQLLAEIGQLVNAHAKKYDGASWGFAGDMAHVAELLQEVKSFLENGE